MKGKKRKRSPQKVVIISKGERYKRKQRENQNKKEW